MLDEFIRSNRVEVITRSRQKVAPGAAKRRSEKVYGSGIPLFVDRLVEQLANRGPLNETAAMAHGKEMLQHGFSIAQVVEDYGHVCQAVTELAIARNAPITTEEFHTLNLCIDTATAEAVTEYQRLRDGVARKRETERLGAMAHELRNVLHSAVVSYDILRQGTVGVGGSVGAILGRSLSRLREVVDRSLAEVRLEAAVRVSERMPISELVADIEVVAAFEAKGMGLSLTVECVEGEAEVEVDRHMLASAVGNLVQNAIKFTRAGGRVALKTRATATRVFIDVEDQCGGLPPGAVEALFQPFEQRSADRSGLGLGLSISRRAVEANGGELHARDVPGTGCVFTIELPRALG